MTKHALIVTGVLMLLLAGCGTSTVDRAAQTAAMQAKSDRAAAEALASQAAQDRLAAEQLAAQTMESATTAPSTPTVTIVPSTPSKPAAPNTQTASRPVHTVGPTSTITKPKPTPSPSTRKTTPSPPQTAVPQTSMTGVTITLDKYHSPIDTFPRNCATPQVWVKNQSNEAVRAVDVTFQVNIYDIAANIEHLGPDTSTGERTAPIPPQSMYSVPLKICIDPKLLPPTPPEHAYPDALTVVKGIVSFKAFA